MPSITNLSTTAALTTVENKIPVSVLVKKSDCEAEIKVSKNKCFTTCHYNKFTNNVLDEKIIGKKLFHESDLNEKSKTLVINGEIKN